MNHSHLLRTVHASETFEHRKNEISKASIAVHNVESNCNSTDIVMIVTSHPPYQVRTPIKSDEEDQICCSYKPMIRMEHKAEFKMRYKLCMIHVRYRVIQVRYIV